VACKNTGIREDKNFLGMVKGGENFSPFLKEGWELNFISYNKIEMLYVSSKLAYLLLIYLIAMLTKYEVLKELRRIGVKDPYLLGIYLRDFENYMITHYGLKIVDTKKLDAPRGQNHPPRKTDKEFRR
jgi:hypothetical protein